MLNSGSVSSDLSRRLAVIAARSAGKDVWPLSLTLTGESAGTPLPVAEAMDAGIAFLALTVMSRTSSLPPVLTPK